MYLNINGWNKLRFFILSSELFKLPREQFNEHLRTLSKKNIIIKRVLKQFVLCSQYFFYIETLCGVYIKDLFETTAKKLLKNAI